MTGPKLEFITKLTATMGPIRCHGNSGFGFRRYLEIKDGILEGPRFSGRVLDGGADWPIVRPDGKVMKFDPRYTLESHDGALIYLANPGIRRAPDGRNYVDFRAQQTGESDEESYFRTTAWFETGDPRYEWMTRSIFIGTGRRTDPGVELSFYEVL